MVGLRRVFLALLTLAASCLGEAAQAAGAQFPALTGRVVDTAQVIPVEVEARLTAKLAALEKQSGRQLVVVTLPDLQGYEIADYGYQLGRFWGIGNKGRNDGTLLIIALKERKLRIEVGYGLEGVLTDGVSSLIINDQIVPKFKAGDIPGGIEAGADAIVHQITLPPAEAQKLAAQASTAAREEGGHGVLVFTLGLFLFFVGLTWWLRRRAHRKGRLRGSRAASRPPPARQTKSAKRARRAAAGAAAVTTWDSSSSSSWSSSSSDWSSSSSDSFSGGGGDFGGGGASGDW